MSNVRLHKPVLILMFVIGLLSLGVPVLLAAQRSTLPSSRVVFSWNRDGDFDLFLLDGDTLKVVAQLTDNRASDLSPTWSPDGSQIAFSSNVSGNYEIYTIDIATGKSSVLTNNNWDDLYPAWSPDGSQIAFTSNSDSNWDVYVMDIGGKGATRLTTSDVYEGNPVWSPDGSQIAFVSGREASRDILVMDANGSNVQPLTTLSTSADFSPAWSPAGDQIAFVSNRSGNPDIFVVDVGCIGDSDVCDANAVNLTADNEGADSDPAWSNNAFHILFASVRNDTAELWKMNADGSDVQQLTTGEGEERFPAIWVDG
ncbi:MAG: DPP IV N-terminal domain-containing protein [Chloroflexi bacterium]|nr:DPP IV N-terminal domain-containing protein [Chloroflexota bacterium]MCC6891497.1 PD40 domain-containing protein [Anaerolineae bacterium]